MLFWVLVALVRRSLAGLAFAVASSYAIAWAGHFFFRRNIPATFRYPVLAGLCDLTVYLKTWRGEMAVAVAKYAPP